jgi:ABC-2 type transport system permease protein
MKNSLIGYMEYRANLFAALIMELVYLTSKILYVVVIYQTGIEINGVSPDEIMLFVASFIIMTGIYTGLFMDNFYGLPEHIRNGTLDMYITKPISLQFMATLRHVNFVLPVPNFIAGIIMLIIAVNRLNIQLTFYNVSIYLLTIVSGTCMAYAIFLAPQILSFWTVKTGAIIEIADRCWDFNNMPMSIYKKWMQRIGIFVIPVFFITNIPAMFLAGRLNNLYFVWAIIAPILFLMLVRIFWKYAIKNYSSASS